jgi:hypothetical protein
MIRSIFSGSWLVFRSGHEYVFIHGETSDFLTVKVSMTAVNMFKKYEMTEEDVAKLAAEWGLYSKRRHRIVDLSFSDDLSEFCQYYFKPDLLRNVPPDMPERPLCRDKCVTGTVVVHRSRDAMSKLWR